MGRLRTFLADNSGAISVEVAIVGIMLSTALAAAVDIGQMVHNASALESAARLGVSYAMSRPGDTSGVEAVVKQATPFDPASVRVTVAVRCECLDGQVVSCQAQCGASPPDHVFLEVRASRTVQPIFFSPWLDKGRELTGQAEFRVQ